MAIYVFDSNEFINLQRRQPIDIMPTLWDIIGEQMEKGVIVSSHEVYDELMIGGDELTEWAKAHKDCFLPSTVEIQISVREILSTHRGLVEGGKKKNKQKGSPN